MSKRVDEINYQLNRLAANIAMSVEYKSWSDDFSRSEVATAFHTFQQSIKENYDLSEFTDAELTQLGFGKWSDELPVRLIPLHYLGALKEGVELTCIDGATYIVGKDTIDNDVRFGCIAYGIKLPRNHNETLS